MPFCCWDAATNKHKPVFILLICTFLLFSCIPAGTLSPPAEPTAGWRLSDLQLLEPTDAENPAQDIIALYKRQNQDVLQIRIDWLELSAKHPEGDIYIALDDRPGGIKTLPWGHPLKLNWDWLIIIPQNSPARVLNSNGKELSGLLQNIIHDAELDISVISLKKLSNSNAHLEVVITHPDTYTISDTANTLKNPQNPSKSSAPLLLTFWNVFNVQTPAQALRRWNGAHTGPLGSRHGLFWLLDAVARYQIPVVLLDLKKPTSLAVLAYMNNLETIRQLQANKLLILPDTANGDSQAIEVGLQNNRQRSLAFGIKASQIAYAPFQHLPPGNYPAAFANLPDPNHISGNMGYRLIPLPLQKTHLVQLDEGGLTLQTKKAILDTALSSGQEDLIVLGGSLPDNLWADASIAHLVFRYISTHPWIHVLNENELLTFPITASSTTLPCPDLLCSPGLPPHKPFTTWGKQSVFDQKQLQDTIRQKLYSLPKNPLSNLAWDMYFLLTRPTDSALLSQLQANHLGQIGHLITAARWAEQPQPINECTFDLDWDGYPECVLASTTLFSSYELDGGRLMFVFAFTQDGLMQWVGPTSQLAIGLSDPTEWQLQYGEASDPAEVPGALITTLPPYPSFVPTTAINELNLIAPDYSQQKIFRIGNDGLSIFVQSDQAIQTQIPFIIKFISGNTYDWENCQITTNNLQNLSCKQLPTIDISGASITSQAFFDSYQLMQRPENPSFEYPPGHYLPFGLDLLIIQSEGRFEISLKTPQ